MSISSPPNYGSPDWQRGAYSAQKLLATANGLTLSVTVDVPPNAEALVVMVQLPPISAPVQCTGVQSGRSYVGARGTIPGPPTLNGTYFFDVSGTVDTQVKVTLPEAPSTTWYVYADAGTRTTMDVANQRSYGGILYTIPSVPSTVAGDHPLNELQVASGGFTANGVAIAAPGAGQRLRIFQTLIGPYIGNPTCYLQDNVGGKFLGLGGPSAPGSVSFYPSGYAMAGNSALDVVINGTTEGVYVVSYTVETI